MRDTPAPQRPVARGVFSGQTVGGRYALSRLIATGGMAEVWQATDTVLERQVAVKILHPHLGDDESFVRRFRTEAVAAARLHHPAIVAIYDTCTDNGVEAIVMELVRGRTLRQFLDDHGPVDPVDAIDIGAEVADALEAAHRAGLVHRDIKPANILLCDDDRVMVTDFGIAKINDDGNRTQTGTMLGTVKYLSPEQVEGAPVDGRTDIYALGIVLYESLCGRPPFSADTQAGTALARLHATPPRPRQVRPSVGRQLDQVVMRAMARHPEDRYQTAADLRAALLAVRDRPEPTFAPLPAAVPPPVAAAPRPTPVTPATGARRRPRRWTVPVLVLLAVTLALSVAGVLLYRTSAGNTLMDQLNQSASDLPGFSRADPLPIENVSTFDPPPGDGVEGDNEVRATFDGNPATGWHTEQYDNPGGRTLGRKGGVGLVVRLSRTAPVRSVRVASPTQDWSAQIYVSDKQGAKLAEWGSPVASLSHVNGSAQFDLDARGRYVLVWITDLGNGPAPVKAQVDEIDVRGG